MRFNAQLKEELNRYEKKHVNKISQTTASAREADEKPLSSQLRDRPIEKVVGGDILWKPIDRAAAMLLAKSPWWAQPPPNVPEQSAPETTKRKPKKKRKHMVKNIADLNPNSNIDDLKRWLVFGDYAIEVRGICKKTGQQLVDPIDAWPILLEQMNKMKHELTPAALAMIDGEKALKDATKTAKECMEEMRSASKVFLDEIRQTKYAVLAETAALVSPLKDIRQFFVGSDYEKEITRLKDFVELCERLKQLKDAGFLDSVADTMLRLAK